MQLARNEPSSCVELAVSDALIAEDIEVAGSIPDLLPAMYHRLRRLARLLLRYERTGHTLQPTAIVNEAFLRLARLNRDVHNRRECFFLLAREMRRVLIDHGKHRRRAKRDQTAMDDTQLLIGAPTDVSLEVVTDLETALQALAQHDAKAAEMMLLRYVFGVDPEELQVYFNTSEATVTRTLRFAKAWLGRFLKSKQPTNSSEAVEPQLTAPPASDAPPHEKRHTLADIARAAGVSAQTVLRVVHNSPHVRQETRSRIWQLLRSTGYAPPRRSGEAASQPAAEEYAFEGCSS